MVVVIWRLGDKALAKASHLSPSREVADVPWLQGLQTNGTLLRTLPLPRNS
ncbi:hypothetical protein CGRA01v4_12311 [Colletotrichum graminicola]|nr:hypothetical protein CGRA01v4_12311 [Colletotrichum graminicola]